VEDRDLLLIIQPTDMRLVRYEEVDHDSDSTDEGWLQMRRTYLNLLISSCDMLVVC
jgi:hypothetical protein